MLEVMKISTEISSIAKITGEEKAVDLCAKAGFDACATPESFNAHLDAVNDDFFVACLDIGHAEMKGGETTAVEMISALGDRLRALHIHDNDKFHDSHQIPFSMDIDFKRIAEALKNSAKKIIFIL